MARAPQSFCFDFRVFRTLEAEATILATPKLELHSRHRCPYANKLEVEESPNHQSPSIATEPPSNGKSLADASGLRSMSVDQLWNLHQRVETILAEKMMNELKELGKRFDQLNTKVTSSQRESRESSKPRAANRRHYPPVLPKYRNPMPPFETWAGRGKQPRWLTAQLRLGNRIEDFRIG